MGFGAGYVDAKSLVSAGLDVQQCRPSLFCAAAVFDTAVPRRRQYALREAPANAGRIA